MEERKRPYLAIHTHNTTKEYYNKESLDTLIDVLKGPSRMLVKNFSIDALIVPGCPAGKVVKACPHRVFRDDTPDVYVAHTVPIKRLVNCDSYEELFNALENEYHLSRTDGEDGNIYYTIEGEVPNGKND